MAPTPDILVINLDDELEVDALFRASAYCARDPDFDFMTVLAAFVAHGRTRIDEQNRSAQRDHDDEKSGDYR